MADYEGVDVTNSTRETWEDRYKRAVARFAGVPADVPLGVIRVEVYAEDGYHYSSYTFEDPNIRVTVSWTGQDARWQYATIEGPEAVGNLVRSFLSPAEQTK